MSECPVVGVVPWEQMCGEDGEETVALRRMAREAEEYLSAHDWCEAVSARFFGAGIGGVAAAFLFQVSGPPHVDEWLWVIVGDLPSAYFVTDQTRRPSEAFEAYADLMDEWIRSVRSEASLADVYPVDAPADEEHAAMLASRTQFIRAEIVPRVRRQEEDS